MAGLRGALQSRAMRSSLAALAFLLASPVLDAQSIDEPQPYVAKFAAPVGIGALTSADEQAEQLRRAMTLAVSTCGRRAFNMGGS